MNRSFFEDTRFPNSSQKALVGGRNNLKYSELVAPRRTANLGSFNVHANITRELLRVFELTSGQRRTTNSGNFSVHANITREYLSVSELTTEQRTILSQVSPFCNFSVEQGNVSLSASNYLGRR